VAILSASDPVLNLQLAARALVAANFPGRYAVEVVVILNHVDGANPRPVRVFMPSPGSFASNGDAPAADPPRRPPEPPEPKAASGAFEPTELQGDILEALEWKALNADGLSEAVGVSRRYLYRKPGGIGELIEQSMVRVESGVGYWRPDMPPPKRNA
jgi:hypothetical protein